MCGKVSLCTLPLSSCKCHCTVPTLVVAVAPLKPLINKLDGFGGIMKSSKQFVMDLLQQLSLKMSYESESKWTLCGVGVVDCMLSLNAGFTHSTLYLRH